ncbi:hypothetical protein I4U23_025020 [Adineta vaga]|nr:hypothetical protein I4U23_025020 [Adineta vaga]
MNASKLICVLSRSSDIFVSWSIGFVILACTVRLITIIHSKHLPQPTPRHVFVLILSMMFCGLVYNWHLFVYPNFRRVPVIDDKTRTFTYCNILFGRHMGYFSYSGFQATQEFLYNAPIVNFIVSSLIPFAIVAATNVVIIVYVLKAPPKRISRISLYPNGNNSSENFERSISTRSSIRHMATQVTRKNVSYETTITVTTSCVFLTTNSIASIYVYLRTSNRSNRTYLKEDLKTSNVYLILRMLTLIDTVLEFYIYFLTGKKFREEVYHVFAEILQYTPLGNYFKFSRTPSTIRTINTHNPRQKCSNKQLSTKTNIHLSEQQNKLLDAKHQNLRETICAIESTV